MPARVILSEHGLTLATRPLGEVIHREVMKRVSEGDAVVELDFKDVLAVSYSFADELIGRLLNEVPGQAVRILNARPEVDRVIQRAMDRRRLGRSPIAV